MDIDVVVDKIRKIETDRRAGFVTDKDGRSMLEASIRAFLSRVCEEQRKICHIEYIENEGNSERDKRILHAPKPDM